MSHLKLWLPLVFSGVALAQSATGIPLEEFPSVLGLNPAGTRLYAIGYNKGGISVIDTDAKSVIATIPSGLVLPVSQGGDLVVSPDGTRIFVADQARNQITVIDAATNKVTAGLAANSSPASVVLTPNGRKLYAANNDFFTTGRFSLTVVDTAALSIKTIPLTIQPTGIARTMLVNPSGTRVYVPGFGSGVSVIDTATDTVIATIQANAWRIALSPDGSRLYLYNQTPSTVIVVNTSTNSVVATIPVLKNGGSMDQIAITPDGTRLFVTHQAGGVTEIDTRTNTVLSTAIVFPQMPMGLAVSADSTTVYVVEPTALQFIDVATNSLGRVLPLPIPALPGPGPVISPDGRRIFVAGTLGLTEIDFRTSINNVVNTASFRPGMVPGAIATILGNNLSPIIGTEFPAGALAYKGVRVTVEYRPVPLLGIANLGNTELINFQVPFELAPPSPARVEVNNNGQVAVAEAVPLFAAQPGIFEYNPDPGLPKFAAIVRLNGSLSGPINPLARGETVMLFATGLGPVLPVVRTGDLGPSAPPSETYMPPTVLIDNLPAAIVWSGYAPGLIGVYQINVTIPAGARSGLLGISITSNDVTSQTSLCAIQ